MRDAGINIFDIGGAGVRFVHIDLAEDKKHFNQQTLFEEAIPSVPRGKNDTLTAKQIRELERAIIDAVAARNTGEIHFVSTGGLRKATNATTLLESLKKVGISVSQICAEEEARCIATAVLFFLSNIYPEKSSKDKILVAKVGGGSAEQSLIQNFEVTSLASIPTGIISTSDALLHQPLPRISHVLRDLRTLQDLTTQSLGNEQADEVVFAGRVMKRIGRLVAREKSVEPNDNTLTVDTDFIGRLIEFLESGSTKKILEKYHVELKEDVMRRYLAGALSMQTVLSASRVESALVSPFSFREGYALQKLEIPWGKDKLLKSQGLQD